MLAGGCFLLSNLTPDMLGPKPTHLRNQKRVSCAVRLSPLACLLFDLLNIKEGGYWIICALFIEKVLKQKGPVTVFRPFKMLVNVLYLK